MSPPSSCIITGIFPLSDGSRNTSPSYYATYLSAIEFLDDEKFINVSIRKYTATSDVLLADDTFVFIVAKAALPAGGEGMLNSIHCAPLISPPDGFQSCYPLEPTHTLFATGTVTNINTVGSTRSLSSGSWSMFEMNGVVLPFASNTTGPQTAGRTFISPQSGQWLSLPARSKISPTRKGMGIEFLSLAYST